jgi:hypothetical protein
MLFCESTDEQRFIERSMPPQSKPRGQPRLDPAEEWGHDFQVWVSFGLLRRHGWRALDARERIAHTQKISITQVRYRCERAKLRMETDSELARISKAVLDGIFEFGPTDVGTPYDETGFIINPRRRGVPKFPPK